ncbi:hypothetical protein [Polynucleobacter hirudinilacicola]|nr:hypothetical protein [Polynucleobacter hirudinilacicola]
MLTIQSINSTEHATDASGVAVLAKIDEDLLLTGYAVDLYR